MQAGIQHRSLIGLYVYDSSSEKRCHLMMLQRVFLGDGITLGRNVRQVFRTKDVSITADLRFLKHEQSLKWQAGNREEENGFRL